MDPLVIVLIVFIVLTLVGMIGGGTYYYYTTKNTDISPISGSSGTGGSSDGSSAGTTRPYVPDSPYVTTAAPVPPLATTEPPIPPLATTAPPVVCNATTPPTMLISNSRIEIPVIPHVSYLFPCNGYRFSAGLDHTLVMQSDGNLVATRPAGVYWSSGTSGNPGAYVVFGENDFGSLQIRSATGVPIKTISRNGPGSGPSKFVLDEVGHIRLLNSNNQVVWTAV